MELDKEFWDEYYRKNAPKMLGICCRYIDEKSVAEDIMHDAFIMAINKAHTFAGKGTFDAWLRKIVVNSSLMYLRNKKTITKNDDWFDHLQDKHEMDEMPKDKMRQVIENAAFTDTELLAIINQLPEHHRNVFNLYVIDNFSHIEIAKTLNISPGTSKSHLARARKKIQQLLYTEAVDRDRQKEKKKRRALILLFPCGKNYIDSLFYKHLHDISIEPQKQFNINEVIDWPSIPVHLIRSSKILIKKAVWFTIPVTGALIFTFWMFLNQSETINRKSETAPANQAKTQDTLVQSSPLVDSSKLIQQVPEKVVKIKRYNVKHQTLKVTKTIEVSDTVK